MPEKFAVQKGFASSKLVEVHAQFERASRTHEHWVRSERAPVYPGTVQISETPKHFSVRAFVSGFDARELDVRIEPHRATIAGKKSGNGPSTTPSLQRDRAAGDLVRIINLPVEVDTLKAVAILKEGVLELMLPKSEVGSEARLEVRSA
jgi:HSP20 family molecular chaperone IbpA